MIRHNLRLPSGLRMGALLSAIGLVAACTGADGAKGDPGPQGPVGSTPTIAPSSDAAPPVSSLATWEKALVGIGGRDRLAALRSVRQTVRTVRSFSGESYDPHDPPQTASEGTMTILEDLANDNLRIDTNRTVVAFGFGAKQTYRQTLRKELGFLDGVESAFGAPGGPMGSDRLAALKKEQRLLNPHRILREALARPASVKTGPQALVDGVLHEVLEIESATAPITLFVHPATGHLAKARTKESDPLHRDVTVEARYVDWTTSAGAIAFPRKVFLSVDGSIVHEETRDTFEPDAPTKAEDFSFPGGATPVHSAADALRGESRHQFHQVFGSIGIPLDGLQTAVTSTPIAPGVFHLTGGSHNSLLVEQSAGLVLVETPLYEERSEAILKFLTDTFPTKKLTHVIVSHFHSDHSAGLRSFVPTGATIVVGESSLEFYREIFAAPSKIRPDALEKTPRQATFVGVPTGGSFTIADATRPIGVHHVRTGHARDMVMVHAKNEQIVFAADIYSPGLPPFPPGPRELLRSIQEDHKLTVTTVAGAHGGTSTLAELVRIATP